MGKLVWTPLMGPPTPTYGESDGSEASIEIVEIDGERAYFVECHCAVCTEIDAVGFETFDPDRNLSLGVYFVRHHLEVYRGLDHAEYDAWIEINEGEQ